ncbi:hypothetical protein [Sediminibacterium soli]|uniref:hypothetical protein n=1 Tax=Sediminibacterium soli TaxID=2698829 RepID=UPI001379C0A6|nr:hypothetical protein [Sediminibacterium soli]NCI47885.1 hypothetical protein [Sediminibacterium soli]
MKNRIRYGWNFQRVLYLLIGIAVIGQSIAIREWAGLLIGGYFAAMGLFAFGCAAGNCFNGSCSVPTKTDATPEQPEEQNS